MNPTPPSEVRDVRDRILSSGQRIMGGKGFSAVGLNEVLSAAGVPKGSFYHYFGSKEAFGEALLDDYFAAYLADMDRIFTTSGSNRAQQLDAYFSAWKENQSFEDCQGRCLAVKLGAEVADLSQGMRAVLQRGTAGIIARLAQVLEAGAAEGSLAFTGTPGAVAQSLYELWLGASLMVKIVRSSQPFDNAAQATRQMLHPAA
ncbi:TetR/AcrR family transcriptional regulator [uncultured Stenotrophomonas sp.]|uniref:TetR/AcrR family transcriptional regulator n=1 Tax=uncultured Stenotrophomonas sp. TaxID=165438 RepID=UPI0028D7ECF8|nr:TetR/AcrR family transcriptional regulator [uncultured Stenotrophomonas sp.]